MTEGTLARLAVFATAAAVLVSAFGFGSAVNARPSWRFDECRFARLDGAPGLSANEVRITLRCAEDKWPAPGGIDKVFDVVGCESGFDENADNPRSSAAGVWQAISSTWSSWRSRFGALVDRWELKASVYNGRANAILGLRTASSSGYGPWSSGPCA